MRYHIGSTLAPIDSVFVFGSNMAGHHYGGAAREAHARYGAMLGTFSGPTGRSYAIPTVDIHVREALPLTAIRTYVDAFLTYARQHVQEQFHVTRIGCGLAGYTDAEIAPMFRGAPDNCSFACEWAVHLEDSQP